ncbi:hypothetical protein BC830DRAFT_1094233 [Chytriomyces sp. MP71]|nr:hypothetical protein BC830DRAFT_1094233 [Chytriomyces sp. MP71]
MPSEEAQVLAIPISVDRPVSEKEDLAVLTQTLTLSDDQLAALAPEDEAPKAVAVSAPTNAKRSLLRSTLGLLGRSSAAADGNSFPINERAASQEAKDTTSLSPDSVTDKRMSKRLSAMAGGIRNSIGAYASAANGTLTLGGVVVDNKVRDDVSRMFDELELEVSL